MSNRSLIEINHDYAYQIEQNSETFLAALKAYLCSGRCDIVDNGLRFIFPGVRVFGMRHHSDSFDVRWGGTAASESSTDEYQRRRDELEGAAKKLAKIVGAVNPTLPRDQVLRQAREFVASVTDSKAHSDSDASSRKPNSGNPSRPGGGSLVAMVKGTQPSPFAGRVSFRAFDRG